MVPFKTKINVLKRGKELVLRKLQVRIDGCGEDNCWNRKKIGCTKKKMTIYTAEKIIENLQRIPIHQLKVQAETYDRGIIFSLLNSPDFEEFHLVLEHGITDDEVELLKRRTKADVRVGNPHPFPIRKPGTVGQNVRSSMVLYQTHFPVSEFVFRLLIRISKIG